MPLVSVIIPTYNYALYIGDAIESVLRQDYPKTQIEIIVYDDGSVDNTKSIVSNYKDSCNIRYYFQKNKGKAYATQQAITLCNGNYIFNLDADDYYLPDKISKTVAVFESDKNIVHVASAATLVNRIGAVISKEKISKAVLNKPINGTELLHYFLSENILFGGGSTYAARSSVLKKINIPAEIDMYIDEFLLYAVLLHGKSFFIENSLSIWRVHGNNFSVLQSSQQRNIARQERSIGSSAILLKYLNENNFSNYIVRVYAIKHANREMAFKESLGTKNISDILKYLIRIIKLKPSPKIVKRYNIFNRLMPLKLLNGLKYLKGYKKARMDNLPAISE
jgi:glycosyltransferase involved in cell wall biosynthesis